MRNPNKREQVVVTATVREKYDVIIAGAGPAGVAAAVTAARNGAKTLLLETHGCLGGIWTSGFMTWYLQSGPGLSVEIAERLEKMGGRCGSSDHGRNYSYDVETMKVLLERLCLEAGIKIRLHTRIVDAVVENGRIVQVVTESKSGRELWPADVFVDCSGDGDLGAFSGCSFDIGGPNGEIQPCSLLGLLAVKDFDSIRDFVSFIDASTPSEVYPRYHRCVQNLLEEFKKAGLSPSYSMPVIFHLRDNLCAIMANHEYYVSAIDADSVSEATIRARAEVYQLIEGLRSLGGKWEGLVLAASAEQIGIREARRLHGLYTMTEDDLKNGSSFPDGVCTCSFGVDVHSPDPKTHRGYSNMGIKVKPYQIPYRAMVAKDVNGLLMAGRCISGTWLAHASYRTEGTAVSLGEAAGKAAAVSANSGKFPHELTWNEISGK